MAAQKDFLEDKLTDIARMIQTQEGDAVFEAYMRRTLKHFRHYSFMNSLLIQIQYPEASYVNSAKRWLETGWKVKPGEKTIHIRTPKTFNKDVEVADDSGETVTTKKAITYFPMVGQVYAIEQCEPDSDFGGERFNPDQTFMSDVGDDATPVMTAVLNLIEKEGYILRQEKIRREPGGGVALGYAYQTFTGEHGIVLDDSKSNGIKARVAIHELAHQRLHLCQWGESDLAKDLREGEAEAVSCLVMYHYGFDVGSNSAAYIRNHGCGHKAVLRSMNRIMQCVNWIIENTEDEVKGV